MKPYKVALTSLLLFSFITKSAGEESLKLPLSNRFIGNLKYNKVVKKAVQENWRALPIGERIAKFALSLNQTPYESYTLEIDNHIEAPSVNFEGLDCWTFFETSMGLARMIEIPKSSYTTQDLLREIEWTRYRGGRCNGNYLERIHYLSEWYIENQARTNIDNITRKISPTRRIKGKQINEMTRLYRHYRYLKNNPSLRQGMKEQEAYVQSLPFHYIPKEKVKEIEHKIKSGDIIGIVTNKKGVLCSHVGIAIRTPQNQTHLMHASTTYKKVVVDTSISDYLYQFSNHAGIVVGRPLQRNQATTDYKKYRKNLHRLRTLNK